METKNLINEPKIQKRFGQAIKEYGITEIFIHAGEVYITSNYDMNNSYYNAIEDFTLENFNNKILNQAQDLLKNMPADVVAEMWDACIETGKGFKDAIFCVAILYAKKALWLEICEKNNL